MTYRNYISLCLSFISVFYLFSEIESFTPAGRASHTSVLVRNKLYFFGGINNDSFSTNEVFYLDVSQPFSITSPLWNDLTANEGMPINNCCGAISLISDANNEQSIYLFGGTSRDLITKDDSFKSLVYKFNLKSGQWEIPIIKGKAPERRREMKAVSNNSGKIYIFGGIDSSSIGLTTINYFNDTVIFDIGELSWSINYQFNAPTRRASYSATLLSNGVIVYIGGYGRFDGITLQIVDISQINLYDTNSLTWSAKTAKLIGQIESRCCHSALLASNGKIIIHGGGSIDDAQVTPDIAVLNTETFEWSAPIVSSNIGKVPSLSHHTSDLVGNYVISAFGTITQPNAKPLASRNANIYIMDVRSFTWVNTFDPENIVKSTSLNPISPTTSAKTTSPSESPSDQSTTMKLVIGILSATFGTATFMVIGFFGYKWYQKKRQNEKIMRIPGNN